jgi:hypothetical protein
MYARKVSPEHCYAALTSHATVMGRVRSEIEACTQLTTLQDFLAIAQRSAIDTLNFTMFVAQMRSCQTSMVNHIISGNGAQITDQWSVNGNPTMVLISTIWKSAVREIAAHDATRTQAPIPLVQDEKQPENRWTDKQVSDVPEKRIKRNTDLYLRGIPVLDDNAGVDKLLRWILLAARRVAEMDQKRSGSVEHEATWRDFTETLIMKVPPKFLHGTRSMNSTGPDDLLHEMINSVSTSARMEAGTAMRLELQQRVNGSFWNLADFAKDVIVIERLNTYTRLYDWAGQTVQLEVLKAALGALPNLTRDQKTNIFTYDDSFDSLCRRIAQLDNCVAGAGDTAESHMFRMQALQATTDQKNGLGLARARPSDPLTPLSQYGRGKGGSTTQRQGRGKGKGKGKGGRQKTDSDPSNPIFLMCTWDRCHGVPPHTRLDCPITNERPCTKSECREAQAHTRGTCPHRQQAFVSRSGEQNNRRNYRHGRGRGYKAQGLTEVHNWQTERDQIQQRIRDLETRVQSSNKETVGKTYQIDS